MLMDRSVVVFRVGTLRVFSLLTTVEVNPVRAQTSYERMLQSG